MVIDRGAALGVIYGEAPFKLSGSVTDAGENGAWTWTSSDETVVRVTNGTTASPTITILKVSETPVTITASYTSDTTGGSAVLALTAYKKSVTITGVTAVAWDYDPNNLTVILSGGEVSGKVNSDEVTVDLTAATGRMTDADAGTDKPVTVTGAKLGGNDKGNYILSAQPADVKVTTDKIAYAGTKTASATVRSNQVTTDATLTLAALPDGASYASTGTVGGTTSALISGTPSISGTTLTYSTTSQENDTSATIIVNVIGAKNYNDYSVVVTITAKDKDEAGVMINSGSDRTATYGDADFTLVKSVSNPGTNGEWSFSSDPADVVSVSATGKVTILKAGSTTIRAKYESDTTVGEAGITLTVNPKTLGITWSNTSFNYDGSPHAPTAAFSSVKSGDDCTVDVSGAQTNAGDNYSATASLNGTSKDNYTMPTDKTT